MTVDLRGPSVPASSRLRSVLPKLSDAERRVALWMLKNVDLSIRQSMSAIAQATDVSDTTVLRMCRTAGFEGFTDLKLALAQEPREAIEHSSGEPEASALQAAGRLFRAITQALNDTFGVLDEATFAKALDLVANAKHIMVGGVGGSGIVAQAFYQRCIRLGLRCDAPIDSQLQIMHAALTGPGDLVVAISYSGITSDPVLVLQEAKARGASTLCITGNSSSALARLADVVLVSVSHEQGSEPMAAQIAQMTLVDALYAALVARNPEPAQLTEERMVNAILPKSI
ncbi:SIS domain-containing protein [Sinorhizobium medicae]|uniref:SIS domain-containing protein n=3 Tax=Sinorhizobium medicae TaxID=110321 RepID=A0A6G1WI56_9HYPH|nr:MurR/RpiR family transcriptional regulator [Sinorhizobium medicae]ABR62826.1 transcriptional regulator, RpiR family [Sinorhizobium medicae WSM419]MBO1942518.1 MurR/RpiR family transcriptional regulator [Sinorhizobium medicae]MDX0403316.1 SIS domain-containing protein [Sinorhizobium medicae]MDX0409678.1 SIS domain-containing protein [Sinorhizobium medicae]MDX0415795.1 SIS domain-containing protein [Sinorhizobium medicae]